MAPQLPKWPEGLTDRMAIKRLRAIVLAAAAGNQDLTNDRQYKALRKVLLERGDLAAEIPRIIRGATNLAQAAAALKLMDRAARQEHVRGEFAPLLRLVEADDVAPDETVDAGAWTGRRTAAEQAAIVKKLAPAALGIVEAMIAEEERRKHNGPPVEPMEAEALDQLRQLKAELEELIALAERAQPLSAPLGRLAKLRDRASGAVLESLATDLAVAPATATTFGYGAIVALLAGWITGEGIGPIALTAGGALMTLHATNRVSKEQAKAKSESQ